MISLPPKGPDRIHDGRGLAAKVEAPGLRTFLAYALSLKDGEGLSEANMTILGEVGAHVEAHEAMPFIIGADFQCPPAAVARTRFAEGIGALIMTTGPPRRTCRMKGSSNEIDYVVISKGMSRAVQAICTVEGVGTRPQVLVRMQMFPRVTSMKALVLRLPPSLPTRRIMGPLREPQCWRELRSRAEELEEGARKGARHGEIEETLTQLYSDWADATEAEIMEATGTVGQFKTGRRGRQPNFVALYGTRAQSMRRRRVLRRMAVGPGGDLERPATVHRRDAVEL